MFHDEYVCAVAQRVWGESSFDLELPSGGISIAAWWSVCFKEFREEEHELFPTLSWVVWSSRCKVTMDLELILPADT